MSDEKKNKDCAFDLVRAALEMALDYVAVGAKRDEVRDALAALAEIERETVETATKLNAAKLVAQGLVKCWKDTERELECERMRLAICGVVAMSDTPESLARARDMHPEYYSASCGDVIRRVDECIRLRKENEELRAPR